MNEVLSDDKSGFLRFTLQQGRGDLLRTTRENRSAVRIGRRLSGSVPARGNRLAKTLQRFTEAFVVHPARFTTNGILVDRARRRG